MAPAMYPEPSGIAWAWWASKHILVIPFHTQTNGKLERYHQTLKRDANQLPYELPSDLEAGHRRLRQLLQLPALSQVPGQRHTIGCPQRQGGKRYYNEGRRCRLKQSNGVDATTGPSGSSPHPPTTPDSRLLHLSQFCWLPTVANTV